MTEDFSLTFVMVKFNARDKANQLPLYAINPCSFSLSDAEELLATVLPRQARQVSFAFLPSHRPRPTSYASTQLIALVFILILVVD